MSTEAKAVTLAAWKKSAIHYPLLPSGTRVGIRIPDLPAMIVSGEMPSGLLDAALGAASGTGDTQPTKELVEQQKKFTDHIVLITVVEPKITEADVQEIPFEDREFLVEIATRQRDLDAEYEHIGGLTSSEKFRRFRGFGEFDANVEGV